MKRHDSALRASFFGLLLAFGAAGCALTLGPSRSKVEKAIEEHEQALLNRASFDLGCSVDKLEMVPLKEEEVPGASDLKICTAAGVRGCGRQASYVYNRTSHVWLMNNEGSDKGGSQAQEKAEDESEPSGTSL